MATFASYAAVAIENARLYQESQEQALISTVMLQVAEASQSLAALDQVLETVVQLASQLVSADRCAIMLWDDTIAAFAPAAAYGFAPTEQSTFEQSLIHLGDLPEFDQLFATGAPTVLYAVDSNPRLNKTLIANTGFESLLLIPLLSQGIVLGAMLVDCENALLTSNTSEMFLDERLIILQGIAHQTAAAVENTRLREAQQAEAYVSAALLQVSQAVSSSTDLDDTLSAIVRITPILVGVEYCLLYLWDETRTAFWLAQSYGLSQEQEAVLSGQIYEPGNFGLLDDVRERNSLATHLFAGMEGEREMLPLDLGRTLEIGAGRYADCHAQNRDTCREQHSREHSRKHSREATRDHHRNRATGCYGRTKRTTPTGARRTRAVGTGTGTCARDPADLYPPHAPPSAGLGIGRHLVRCPPGSG
jgi:GAF domain-containing protein